MPGTLTRLATILTVAILSLRCQTEGRVDLRVAVASNFAVPIEHLVAVYERETGRSVSVSLGSTGSFYAQIVNGAPFDVFLAADAERPSRLEREGHAVDGSRFTYAIGKLVLWSPNPDFVDEGGQVLADSVFRFLAIANPSLAPYGVAAHEVLERMGLWKELEGRIAQGENIGQAFQFVSSGNAEVGFVAYSQVLASGAAGSGSLWMVPDSLYSPIEQQAVLLREHDVAEEFLLFLGSAEARGLIRDFGYDTP